jgi:hypothetical protein
MYHPSIWHPIQPLDMAAAFRSIRQTTSSPNSITTSPEKNPQLLLLLLMQLMEHFQ